MKLSRDMALKWHYFFDQVMPPFMREWRWLMAIPMRVAFGRHAGIYLDFKKTAYALSEEEFRAVYSRVSDKAFERETDLNQASIEKIQRYVQGPKVLEVGCGKGFLAKLLSQFYEVTAVDMVIQPNVRVLPGVHIEEANAEALPFPDKHFDTVVCTHTLEHVRNLYRAIAELRRVAGRVIIVVPRQRPYRYTFDLHLNFFPYLYSLQSALGLVESAVCEDADGDTFYMESEA